jgi:hypothetical protein
MENSPDSNLAEKLGDSNKIIALLEEQNKTLHALLNFNLIQEKKAFHRAIYGIVFHAIPYIVMIIIGLFVYQTLHTYLDTVNNKINALNTEFTTIKTDITNLPTTVQNSVLEGLSSINPFK